MGFTCEHWTATNLSQDDKSSMAVENIHHAKTTCIGPTLPVFIFMEL